MTNEELRAQLRKVEAERDRLLADTYELSALHRDGCGWVHRAEKAEAKLAAVEAERDAARGQSQEWALIAQASTTALARYGRHESMCEISQGQRVGLVLPNCTCGFDEVTR